MEFTTTEVARAVDGQAYGPEVVVTGVATDTRALQAGQLFVPLRAARDGHDFIPAALAMGAPAYLTETVPMGAAPIGGTAVVVAGTGQALLRLAGHGRNNLSVDSVGVTGSVGKTTTKDLTAAVLSADRPTYASPRSFNNAIGVPLTILNAGRDARALVIEMGANAPGEIAQLCTVARPTVGVVTRVAPAHTLGFGDVEGVARAKAELVAALPSHGTAVLNADDARVKAMARGSAAAVITFGSGPGADVRVEVVEMGDDLRPRARFETPWGHWESVLSVRGAHQALNAAAAVAVCGCLGVPVATMAEALPRAEVTGRRMQLRQSSRGVRVLDDSYNSSPVAVEAALSSLATVPARRRVAVLGPMSELGDISAAEHRRVAELASSLGIEVLAVGAPEFGVTAVEDLGAAQRWLEDLEPGDIVLVKGSRQAGMDALADILALGPGPAPKS